MIAIQFCPHSTAGLNEPFITNFLSFGCLWFYLLCNFLISFFWYYLYCIAITSIIIPAVIYIILLPDASSRLLIQPNCTLILMLIFPPPPLSPKRFSYRSYHRKKFSFFVFPTVCTECWYLALLLLSGTALIYTWTSHLFFFFFSKKNFMHEKKIKIMKFSIISIDSHYVTRQNVIFWVTIVLLFFNIK